MHANLKVNYYKKVFNILQKYVLKYPLSPCQSRYSDKQII